jgi:hypothetical protein
MAHGKKSKSGGRGMASKGSIKTTMNNPMRVPKKRGGGKSR